MKLFTLIILVFLAGLVGLRAEETLSQAPEAPRKPKLISEYDLPGLDTKITLDVIQPMDVVDLIKYLAMKGNLNIVWGRDVTGTTKLMLKEVALSDALEIVLAANNLAYELKGNIIKIMTDREYRELYGQGFYEQRQAKIIELKYAIPSRVAQLLAEIKSTIGKVVFDDNTGTLVLIDTPERIEAMEKVIAREELPTVERVWPTETKVFTLQYGLTEAMQNEITPMLTKDVGKMRVDKRTKTIIITDLPQNLAKISDVIGVFDKPNRQVFIEAKIVQVVLNNEFRLGVNWDHIMNYVDPRFSLGMSSQFPLDLLPSDSKGTLTYRTITGGGDLNAVLQAIESMGDTKILSNPHIAALDSEEATIKVVTDQPYAEYQFESGSTNVIGKTYKFIPVGVTLAVTPKINDEGFISVSIRPEVSSITTWYDGLPQRGVPVVKKSYAETSVSVKDGVTIIIAGMIEERKESSVVGLPLLSKIPLLGALFRSQVDSVENVETIVFLTPKIVTGAEPYLRSKDLKELKKTASLPPKANE